MGANGLRMRYTPAVPTVAVAVLVATVLTVAVLIAIRMVRVSPGVKEEGPPTATTQSAPAAAHEWDFVLRSPRPCRSLRHRPGLTPIDIVSTHAFGWDGLTIRETSEHRSSYPSFGTAPA